jgi:hypothetical protein
MLHDRDGIENLSFTLHDLRANARAQIQGGPRQSASQNGQGQPYNEEGHPTRSLNWPVYLSRDSHVIITLSQSSKNSKV